MAAGPRLDDKNDFSRDGCHGRKQRRDFENKGQDIWGPAASSPVFAGVGPLTKLPA